MIAAPGLFPCTGVGSLPHRDPSRAVREVLSRFREIPYWPQLPMRTPLEHMYSQFAASLPGATISGDKLGMESGEALLPAAEAFYERFLGGEVYPFAIPAERAAGLHEFLATAAGPFPAVKGQVTGPISFGLMVCDRQKKPVFYDPVGRDVLVKYLLRVAQWQAERLSRLSPAVIVVLDEPYLASVGSAILSLPREEVVGALDEIFDGLAGTLCGIHCCANTDWGLVLSSRVGYLSFDAYEYADSLLLYAEELNAFLARGGKIAFGIVPTARDAIASETPGTLA
ncbi:MAG: methionine synthase, partial [Verrucomicrobiota bacterium]